MKVTKKPIEVDAVQITNVTLDPDGSRVMFEFSEDAPTWLQHAMMNGEVRGNPDEIDTLLIETLEGPMKAIVSTWIMRGVEGELYPCKDSVFQASYDY